MSGGACVTAQAICVGGSRDAASCDCPESTCLPAGCADGPNKDFNCNAANDCGDGTCRRTVQVCGGGEMAGAPCVHTDQCGGELFFCIANGRYCWGGSRFKLGCVDDPNCDPGTCSAPGQALPLALLCSAGSNDGAPCDSNADCPSGACVQGGLVCDGGATNGSSCESDTDCEPESPCVLSQKILRRG